ncbi:MAG: hypothetical protein Q4C06_00120 [Bacillota bacterium]|nr:hypothetical protein [Bacillota bacterium]
MKKILPFLLSCTLLCIITSCTKEEPMTELEAVQKQLLEMEGYSCTATLSRTANEETKTYEIAQYYKSTGEYRLELTAPETVAGNYTIYDGNRICQYNTLLGSSVIQPSSQHRSELFLGQFIEHYLQSEGVSVEAAALEDSQCILLEAVIPGRDTALASEKLWIDRSTLLPVRLAIFDAEEKEHYRLDYTTFTFNPQFDAALFTIEE